MRQLARHFHELELYQLSFEFQQSIFEISRSWPANERHALTNQIRRSSRSIGANLAESWAKRRYPAHFLSKLTDCDGELQESLHWISTASACGYLCDSKERELRHSAEAIGKMIGGMMARHDSFRIG